MKKPVVILVLLLALVAMRPARRAHVEPLLAEAATLPVIGARSLMEPLFESQARGELKEIRAQLQTDFRTGGRLPTGRQFRQYLQRNQMAGGGSDPWGSLYTVVRGREGVEVVSPGPDKVLGSEDDLREPLNFTR